MDQQEFGKNPSFKELKEKPTNVSSFSDILKLEWELFHQQFISMLQPDDIFCKAGNATTCGLSSQGAIRIARICNIQWKMTNMPHVVNATPGGEETPAVICSGVFFYTDFNEDVRPPRDEETGERDKNMPEHDYGFYFHLRGRSIEVIGSAQADSYNKDLSFLCKKAQTNMIIRGVSTLLGIKSIPTKLLPFPIQAKPIASLYRRS